MHTPIHTESMADDIDILSKPVLSSVLFKAVLEYRYNNMHAFQLWDNITHSS
jgi:hypothetical protein